VAEPTAGVLYADTSALVKLVVREAESDAIEAEVARWDLIATGDAIHLASALTLADDLAGVLTYDHRMADAARARGVAVVAPS
jgi:predicted nucleic acid-binding protein